LKGPQPIDYQIEIGSDKGIIDARTVDDY